MQGAEAVSGEEEKGISLCMVKKLGMCLSFSLSHIQECLPLFGVSCLKRHI
jgi:hypothetical protein